MTSLRGLAAGMLIGLAVALATVAPARAEQEIPTGAARLIEKVEFQILVGTIQLETHIDRILENNAGVIPGK